MRSKALVGLGCLLATISCVGFAQPGTGDSDRESALIHLPGLKTDDLDLAGLAAASFRLPIQYGDRLDAGTFGAFLNGTDITARFNARPGAREEIALPLREGENELILSACSTDGGTAPCQSRSLRLVKREIKASYAPIPVRLPAKPKKP